MAGAPLVALLWCFCVWLACSALTTNPNAQLLFRIPLCDCTICNATAQCDVTTARQGLMAQREWVAQCNLLIDWWPRKVNWRQLHLRSLRGHLLQPAFNRTSKSAIANGCRVPASPSGASAARTSAHPARPAHHAQQAQHSCSTHSIAQHRHAQHTSPPRRPPPPCSWAPQVPA